MFKKKYLQVTSIIATILLSLSLTIMFVLEIYTSAFDTQKETLKPFIFLCWCGVITAGFLYLSVIVLLAAMFGMWIGSHLKEDEDEEEYEPEEFEEEQEDETYNEGVELP